MNVDTFSVAYKAILKQLLTGTRETNTRTGAVIRTLPGGHSFKIALDRLPVAGNRRYWPKVAAAETAWQLLGTKDPKFIMAYAPKLWSKFIEDEELKTAYGYRWRLHFGRDQIAMAINALISDPTNRQVYVSAWDPSSDGLGEPVQPKNIPCPVGFSLTRVEDRLHCSVFIRSSDVFVGLPYDVMSYALTTDAIAAEIGCRPGTLHVTLAHPHLYETHWRMAYACIDGNSCNWTQNVEPQLPAWTVKDILAEPDRYVRYVDLLAERVNKSDYSPKPMVIV